MAPGRVLRGIARAVVATPVVFAAVAAAMLAVQILLPPAVLSIARKPADYFTINAWLSRLPEYLGSSAPLGEKAGKLWALALFWFSSSNLYGVEWGFAVDVGDLVRMTFTALLVAAYFALWRLRRRGATVPRVVVSLPGAARGGGVAGAFVSVLGLSTGPCSVMGCGAPVIPVVGLALAGVSSTTLTFLRALSTWATAAVLVAMTLGVAYLGWMSGGEDHAAAPPPG